MKKDSLILLIIIFIIFMSNGIIIIGNIKYNNSNNNISITTTRKIKHEEIKKTKEVNITITAVGDCTIGYDDNFGYSRSFNEVYDQNGPEYFFSDVLDIFAKDDITVANLEGTFTKANIKKEKAFNFKGPLKYVEILKKGSIEIVNLANNHTYDYNEVGFNDTIKTLQNANINYFGYDMYYILKKENISIGFAGIFCIEDRQCTKKIDTAISDLKSKNINTIILSFHWGIEKSYKQSSIQTYLAHYAIDNGAELILGHHPHVLQGIELYKDKYIVYSLANFSFGGNKNPADKDTMIFQTRFKYIDGALNETLTKVFPARISSIKNFNDYKPNILKDEEYDRVMKKIQTNSIGINLT